MDGACTLLFTTLSDEDMGETCADGWLGDWKGGTLMWATTGTWTQRKQHVSQKCFESIAMTKLLLEK